MALRRRWFIQISALSTFDGRIVAYHGFYGWKSVARRHDRWGTARGTSPGDTAGSEDASRGADSGASSPREPPERMQSGGLRMSRGFRSMLPPGLWRRVGETNGELGFYSGEGAWETATTSKEGSRRANYPIPTRGGSDNKYWYRALLGLVIGMSTI